jgi:integrase
MNDLTYDVRIWSLRVYAGKNGKTYSVRWRVAERTLQQTFSTRKLADSFRAQLTTAARQGVAFDVPTGLPAPLARAVGSVSWYQHAMDFVDMKWSRASPRHRRSIAESLTCVTPALVKQARGRPGAVSLRQTLYQWSFNTTRRATEPDTETRRAHDWLNDHSQALTALTDAATTRRALDALATKLDGGPAAKNTIARKRAVFYGALRYAVELDRLAVNPIEKVQWATPKGVETLDRRVLINPQQAIRLLAAVEAIDPAMVAFFACMYYAALRPGEALDLHERDCSLPEAGWGDIVLAGSTGHTGTAWNDDTGSGREDRGLKHRARGATRPIPVCPELVRHLRHHITTYGTGQDGRLFVTRTGPARIPVAGGYGNPVSGASYGKTWRKARAAALTPQDAASPLARRPYDLRHACVSLWLNAGVPATQVAEWAGHSVAVLLRVYAACIDGQDVAARGRIADALAGDTDVADGRTKVTATRGQPVVAHHLRHDPTGLAVPLGRDPASDPPAGASSPAEPDRMGADPLT